MISQRKKDLPGSLKESGFRKGGGHAEEGILHGRKC